MRDDLLGDCLNTMPDGPTLDEVGIVSGPTIMLLQVCVWGLNGDSFIGACLLAMILSRQAQDKTEERAQRSCCCRCGR
jgi:hypothetical protein